MWITTPVTTGAPLPMCMCSACVRPVLGLCSTWAEPTTRTVTIQLSYNWSAVDDEKMIIVYNVGTDSERTAHIIGNSLGLDWEPLSVSSSDALGIGGDDTVVLRECDTGRTPPAKHRHSTRHPLERSHALTYCMSICNHTSATNWLRSWHCRLAIEQSVTLRPLVGSPFPSHRVPAVVFV